MDVQQIFFSALDQVELRRETIEESALAPHDARVAPHYLGICGSDLHVLHGRHPFIKPPLVIGHEASARVVAVGNEVEHMGPGDDVVLNPLIHCGLCRACSDGRDNHCQDAAVIGFKHAGIGQTRFTAGAAQFHRLPDGLSVKAASLSEPLAVGYHAARRADDLDKLLIIGGGTIGLSLLLALRDRDSGEITLVEPDESKRQVALELGADEAIAPDAMADLPTSFTAAFDCVASQQTLDAAAEHVMGGATVVVVGVPEDRRALALPRMQRFEIDLHGSGMYTGADIDAAMHAMVGREARFSSLISDVFSLDKSVAAFAVAQESSPIKVLIAMA